MEMLRFIAASLFLAVAVVLSITASDVFAAGKNEAMALVETSAGPGPQAVNFACADETAGEQEKYHQDCCDGLFCAVATALVQTSAGSGAVPASDAIYSAESIRMAGRNVAPELVATSVERIVIEMRNHSMMTHSMHLHGHYFQVVAIDGVAASGAIRDTVAVPPMSRLAFAFDAGNPGGDWAFHCHHLYHMASGMMTAIRYVES
jgi:hypothetical protein